MTLTLLAVSLNEQPLSQPITACFDANGGTIGRADHNTMALPDPERHISRLQAEIIATGSRYLIKNVGAANPIVVGARSLSMGESTALTDRDQVRIGGYLLQVVVDAEDDPRGADITRGRAAVAAGQAPYPAPFPSSYHPEPRQELRSDPRQAPNPVLSTAPPRPAPAVGGLADFGTPLSSNNPFAGLMGSPPPPGFGLPPSSVGGSSGNTFADLLPGPAGVRSGSSALGAAPPDQGTRPFSPADLDVFATPRSAPAALPPASADDPFAGLIPASAPPSSMDDFFGLRGASSGAGADPLARFEAGLGGGGAQPGAAPAPGGLPTDPLALFGAGAGAGAPPPPTPGPVAANHTPDILAGFTPPKPILPPAPPTAQLAPPPFVPPPVVPTTMKPAPAVANPRAGNTFDWANPVPPTRGPLPEPVAPVPPPAGSGPDLDLDFAPPSPPRRPTPGAVYGAPPVPAAPPLPLPPPAATPAMAPTAQLQAPAAMAPGSRVPAAAAGAGGEALWAAFCQGAGIDPAICAGADEAMMRDIGALLRAAVGGTLQLMSVRATTKGELGAAVTIIQQRGNNPLKFSPDATTGLEQLLRPPMRGFLSGPAAMTDAMHDLVGHAIGTVAGMRAALDGMLERFAPGQLESKMVGGSLLDSVLPMNRKAKLWELYLQHFESIREEAQEDFHNLFGKAFLAAYEQQVERLKQSGGPG